MRKLTIALLAVLAAAAAAAPADQIRGKRGITYTVSVLGAEDFAVTYRLGASRKVQPVAEIEHMQLDNAGTFNRAEDLLREGSPDRALEAYDTALRQAGSDWRRRLIRYRRMEALSRAGRIDKALAIWLEEVDLSSPSSTALSSMPAGLAPEGSSANAEAIRQLERAREPSRNDDDLSAAIDQLLLKLYRKEGRTDEAAELAGEVVSSQPDEKANGGRGPSGTRTPAQLDAVEALLEQGAYARAADAVASSLDGYSSTTLSKALLLLGKARWGLYRQDQGNRSLAVSAGLDFMRVAVFYPSSEEAPEAMYLAGRVNEALGNRQGAVTAYTETIKRYPESRAAGQAGEARKRLMGS